MLASAHTVADLRRAAKRTLPRSVFDFVESGAEDEVALRRNRSALDAIALVPRALRGAGTPDTRTKLLGLPATAPFALAPTGLTRLVHPAGEPAVARAAAAAGIPYASSAMSSVPLERIAAAAPVPIFQIYMVRDREVCAGLLRRAQAAGCEALILTVDSQVSGLRERDLRNGLTIPPTIRPRVLLDGLLHPRWALGFARSEQVGFANFAGAAGGEGGGAAGGGSAAAGPEDDPAKRESLVAYVARELDTSLDWSAVDWVRERWPGTLAIKGLLNADDAREAVARGADAVVVSNHGGRQLGTSIAPIEVLPEVVAAVGGRAEVLMDSGIRRGADVVKALALGASGVLLGRPYLLGLGAAGEPGVARVIEILSEETRRTMTLLGAADVAAIEPSMVRQPHAPTPPPRG